MSDKIEVNANRIKKQRIAIDLTVAELLKKMEDNGQGMSRSTYERIEKGTHTLFNVDHVAAIARALKCPLHNFTYGPAGSARYTISLDKIKTGKELREKIQLSDCFNYLQIQEPSSKEARQTVLALINFFEDDENRVQLRPQKCLDEDCKPVSLSTMNKLKLDYLFRDYLDILQADDLSLYAGLSQTWEAFIYDRSEPSSNNWLGPMARDEIEKKRKLGFEPEDQKMELHEGFKSVLTLKILNLDDDSYTLETIDPDPMGLLKNQPRWIFDLWDENVERMRLGQAPKDKWLYEQEHNDASGNYPWEA